MGNSALTFANRTVPFPEFLTANLFTTLLFIVAANGDRSLIERGSCRSRYHGGRETFHRMTSNLPRIRVLGAGLAGPEAALQAARRGCYVDLYEMRPVRSTEAHQTSDFAELVCSNSLKSESENTAPWLLKQEMRRAGSVLLQAADAAAVPAGHALAVDRVGFPSG